MHTTAEQYSPQKKIHLFICTNPGKCWIAVHINNLAEVFRESIHLSRRKSKRSRKSKRANTTASWKAVIYEISLPYLILKARLMEMMQLHIGIPIQVLRILPRCLFKRTTNLNTIRLDT